jgi:hypothetical protein
VGIARAEVCAAEVDHDFAEIAAQRFDDAAGRDRETGHI